MTGNHPYRRLLFLMAGISLLLVSCEDLIIGSAGSAAEGDPVMVRVQLSDPLGEIYTRHNLALTENLTIEEVDLGFSSIGISSRGNGSFQFVLPDSSLSLTLSDFDQEIAEKIVPLGTYDLFNPVFHTESADSGEGAFSLKISGSYLGEPFSYSYSDPIELQYELNPELHIGYDSDTLTILKLHLDYTRWFSGVEEGQYLSPLLDENRDAIDKNILESISLVPSRIRTGENHDEDLNRGLILISVNDVSIDETLGNLKFTVSLNAASDQTVEVDYTTGDETAFWITDDYEQTSGTLVFEPGQTTAVVEVPVLDDLLAEGDETLVLNLSNAVNAAITRPQGIGTLLDDDVVLESDLAGILIDDPVIDELLGTLTYTVTLDAASDQTVEVDFATEDGTALLTGEDYTPTEGTLVFEPGQTTATVDVSIFDDQIVEKDETLILNLTNAVNATIVRAQGVGTILNNDLPSLSISDAGAVEGEVLNYTVRLSEAFYEDVVVEFATTDGTALPDKDYTHVTEKLVFLAGETSKQVPVTLNNDKINEATETMAVKLSNPSNATIADGDALGTIDDDDVVSLSVNDPQPVEENTGKITFTVSMDILSDQEIRVNYATSDGDATVLDKDYVATSGTLIFKPGVTDLPVTVEILDTDALLELITEPDEHFYLDLSQPVNAVFSDSRGMAIITDEELLGLLKE